MRNVWQRDELILALDLYLRVGLVDATNPEAILLSKVLQGLPIHDLATRESNFRSPSSVAMKLSNIANHDPSYRGKVTNGSKSDAAVWAEFQSRPDDLRRVSVAIRELVASKSKALPPEADEEEIIAPEGRLLYRRHRTRERDKALRRRKIDAALRVGKGLSCEVCDFNFEEIYGLLGRGFMECHHVVPLHISGETITRLRDLALICSNCHSMIHRQSPWPTPGELRDQITRNM